MNRLSMTCGRPGLAFVATGIALAGSTGATAQTAAPAPVPEGQLQEIVVTAQKRSESLQNVPVSVTAVSAKTLAAAHITSLEGVTTLDPSLRIGSGTGQALPVLRGIGNPVRNIGNEASTSIYIDGIYYSRIPAAFFELNNVSRIEILKGPQGTLFGRNSEGGLIQIITRDPSLTRPAVDASLGYGNFDTFRGSLYASAPITDSLAVDISALEVHQGDGWGRDITTGGKNGFEDNTLLRSKLLFRPSDRTEIKLSADYINTKSTAGISSNAYRGTVQGNPIPPYAPLFPLPFYDTRGNVDSLARSKGWGVSGRIQQDLGFADLVSLTAFRHTRDRIHQDGDVSPVDYVEVIGQDAVDQTSEELQLQSKRGSPVTWIAGFYYLNQKGVYDPFSQRGERFGSNRILIFARQRDVSYAGFGQATVHPLPKFDLTVGARYTTDAITASGHTDIESPADYTSGAVSAGKKNYQKMTYKASVAYHFDRDISAYFTFSTGFKAGVFNTLPISVRPVLPETITAYEVGEKAEFFDHKLRINSAFFYYDIKNPQVQTVVATPATTSILLNAKSAHSRGFDFSSEAVVVKGLTLSAGFTILDAQYDNFPNAPSYPPLSVSPYGNGALTSINASGKRLPQSPKFAFNVGADYVFKTAFADWDANIQYSRSSRSYWDPDNIHPQRPFGLLGATLAFSPNYLPGWSLRVWGKNLTGSHYYWGESESVGTNGTASVPAPPRTFGFSIDYKL